ncbi:hypothetical protein [Archangium lansingense]|uniref:Uncharacterized protein n=1 Tax=Archangium lansingense TaxID=2995310 RepID=A0ABT4A1R2_9BACT|nr:hypothetical protein [Archangium lansinium]MCY1075229.1 hypothetical protein [Archangium lansinium]
MRTKLCVLGAVLGTASVLPVVCLPEVPAQETKEEQPRGGVSRQAGQLFDGHATEPLSPVEVPASPVLDEPKHPCELVTVMRVPCDPSASTCEYTYWECPQNVKPLRA